MFAKRYWYLNHVIIGSTLVVLICCSLLMTETANYSFLSRTKDYEKATLDPRRNLAVALKFKSLLGLHNSSEQKTILGKGRIRQKSH